MSPLARRLREEIALDGPMSLERFMAAALTDPKHGYYATRDPFGAAGDFITAPEISQIFGELIGLWAADLWARMGASDSIRLVELGPGRGTLIADALRAARAAPAFHAALSVDLIETSPVLTAIQRRTLASATVPIHWRTHFASAPKGPKIVLANEFFDALPVRHYVRTAQGWRERLIGIDPAGAFAFGLAPHIEDALQVAAPIGAVLEIGLTARQLMGEIGAAIARDGGAALIIDYGYTSTRLGASLQALRNGGPCDPLDSPGECDLTAHVDFSALAQAARAAGATTFGPVDQGPFLLRLGLAARADALKINASEAQIQSVDLAVARLAGADPKSRGMGKMFKVLAVASEGCPLPAGFEEAKHG